MRCLLSHGSSLHSCDTDSFSRVELFLRELLRKVRTKYRSFEEMGYFTIDDYCCDSEGGLL